MLKMNIQFFATGDKYERRYLTHYVDSSFAGTTASYVLLGKDIEEYIIEMNPNVSTITNILGETSNNLLGFQASSSVDTFYAYEGDPLFEQLMEIVNTRATGTAVESYIVDVLVDATGTVEWAYREKCLIVPQSLGGQNGGINIPFQVLYNGGRVSGEWDVATKTFTPD